MIKKNFTFAILTFNHELYIIEHLESIKFLIENFGSEYNFNLIVADDGSRDKTLELVNRWLSVYGLLFTEINIMGDGTNRGTCFNYTRIWPLIDGDLFKITAGDDVYSCANIFEEVEKFKHNDFFSGLPLLLIDGEIHDSHSMIFHILATDVIYRGKKLLERIGGVSSINTPSLFCNRKFLLDSELLDFVNSYRVTEDFPMMAKIATSYENISFIQSHEIYIYYRRTSGSTYLIRGSDFDLDKLQAFNHILTMEKSWTSKIILINRIFCYKLDNKILKKILNIGYYVYLFRLITNIFPIFRSYSKTNIDVSKHKAHYSMIAKRSNDFIQQIGSFHNN